MGVGPPIIALYTQLKGLGVFDDVNSVIELGAQNVWCPRPQLIRSLFEVFNRPPPSQVMLDRFAKREGSARELHEALGHSYRCVDVDPQFNSISLDLNFDECPQEHRLKYDFVTNHGTSEHLLNQYNFFKVFHDFTKPGGFMMHAVPFTVHVNHGFFNYQPNFFEALCRYNSYKLYGIWIGPDWQSVSLVPWEPDILDYMVLNAKTTQLLVVLMQKQYDEEFCVPFQDVYEKGTPDDVMNRYCLIVDGELYDGSRVKHLTTEKVIADEVAKQLAELRNAIQPCKPVPASVATRRGNATSSTAATVPADAGVPVDTAAPDAGIESLPGRELAAELVRRIRRRLFRHFKK